MRRSYRPFDYYHEEPEEREAGSNVIHIFVLFVPFVVKK